MGAALTLGILAAFGLIVAGGAFALYVLWLLVKVAARFIQHEMLMRPKERYYTM